MEREGIIIVRRGIMEKICREGSRVEEKLVKESKGKFCFIRKLW